jgi:hypothetical protein
LKVIGSVGLIFFQRKEKASSGFARPGRFADSREPSRAETLPSSSARDPADASVISLREIKSARISSSEMRILERLF